MSDGFMMYFMSFVGTYFITLFFIYCWKNIQDPGLIKINRKSYIMCALITLFTSSSLIFIKVYPVKIILNIGILIIFNYFLYTKEIKRSIIIVILLQILIMISEVIYAISIGLINIDLDSIYPCSELINGVFIALISYGIWETNYPQKILKNILIITNSFKGQRIIISSILMLLVAIISTMAVYLEWDYVIVLTINTLITLFFIYVSIKFATAQSKYNEINNKYETSITSLREYEAMIDKYRIYNHENKNELQTLRNLISKKNTKALKYIDSILDNKIKDNEKIMHKTSKIPEGGLRATIYSKLCMMDELGIKYSLDIAKDIRTVDLINMKEDIVLNICKILGVFLDNAIEAVKDLKTKHIGIEIYLMDGDLCVDITNNYEGKLDINKIGSSKYTTKGGNHGYGLSLVNQIISNYPDVFENEKSITKNTFTQKIKIKM